ncbi:DNA alkylation repair protein [Aliivibrio kagoshimensis]|uniref:DNA alkylation repair protein n=1 Tax=Aliivibrio kagoshimensis TaxID=2910230 RepID=UPI003D1144D8
MPEPLKNLYNEALINALSEQLSVQCAEFDSAGFSRYIFDKEWQEKELKARMAHISAAFNQFIPLSYPEQLEVLMAISPNFSGFESMFFPGFVELYGLDDYDNSIVALEHFTKNSSSEFAVRPFIIKYNHKMMTQMEAWSESGNHHVRRLATEGCRSRLPWAMALPEFKKNPSAVMTILERLKNDDSEYVRRSVANNLNDISKDNPNVVIDKAKQWIGGSKETDWVVKHGCRTLLKQGESNIMALFGYEKPEHIKIKDFELPSVTRIGDSITFEFTLVSQQALGKLRIEYAVNHLKKNGSHTRKVFKLSESENRNKIKLISKSHSFKKISTRVYYAGIHGIAIIVNGHEIAYQEFQLDN